MVEVYDIETLKALFTYTGLDIETKKVSKFIICRKRNDLCDLVQHLNTVKGQIGYNNLSFDSQVIEYILRNWHKWFELSGHDVCLKIYEYAQVCIDNSNKGAFSHYPEWKLTIKQLDLFKIWHFNNRAKMTSLKWIEFMIDFPNVEEMSIDHWVEEVTDEEIEQILSYNENDVMATYEFYLYTIGQTDHPLYKGIDRIQLRKDIIKEFKIPCINYNDVKIGDELNKLGYMTLVGGDWDRERKAGLKPLTVKTDFTFGDCIPNYVFFKTPEFNEFFERVRHVKVDLDAKQEFIFKYGQTSYSIMKGGIHSHDEPRIIRPNENEDLRDADIGSQYPNAIRKRRLFPPHLGEQWLENYVNRIKDRMIAKGLYKDTKEGKYQAIQEAYKLALNGGGFGKLGEESSWQYCPFTANCVTIGNQFEILMLIEMLELAGITVLSANTDGIVCLFDKELNDIYYDTCKDWEKLVGNSDLGQLEYVDYKMIAQTSVNDYIAIKTDGKVKTKGDFMTDFELHKNKSARIVPIALQEYYSMGIDVTTTITNHSNIYDFCLGVKGDKGNKYVHLNAKTLDEQQLQKNNRYYMSTNGKHLIKIMKPLANKKPSNQLDIFGVIDDGTRKHEVESGWLSTVFNRYVKKDMKDYHIDYSYYIGRAMKIIDLIK